ncbi:DEAD/DEAH box helicase family protein [Streptomyces sp. YPW6]|uniref:DEAD/DEAH box helicase family protein n=1 Tax=Streptomyces sp. YPW6 TaxID=2840373 RepID=UPI003D72FD58
MATDTSSVAPDRHPPLADAIAPVRRMLRSGRQAAVDSGVRGLLRPGSRGRMVFACGTGKKLIALRTAETLDTRFLLVWCRPGTISQWAQAARADGRREPLMAVSSPGAHKHPVLAETGAVSTGSGEHLVYWLAQRAKKNEPGTVFVTLGSLPRSEEVHRSVLRAAIFDLAIVDEAHRTAGGWDKDWTVIHDSSRIRARAPLASDRDAGRTWSRPRMPAHARNGPRTGLGALVLDRLPR